MIYAYLQLARDGDARKTYEEARTAQSVDAARSSALSAGGDAGALASSAAPGARRRSSAAAEQLPVHRSDDAISRAPSARRGAAMPRRRKAAVEKIATSATR